MAKHKQGHVCLHGNTCLALIADVSQWTEQKKKKSAGRGGGGIKNASITNFLLFTYSKNELLEWEKENPGKRQGSWAS